MKRFAFALKSEEFRTTIIFSINVAIKVTEFLIAVNPETFGIGD